MARFPPRLGKPSEGSDLPCCSLNLLTTSNGADHSKSSKRNQWRTLRKMA